MHIVGVSHASLEIWWEFHVYDITAGTLPSSNENPMQMTCGRGEREKAADKGLKRERERGGTSSFGELNVE